MATTVLSATAVAAVGVLSHVIYFNKGEHHMWAVTYGITFAASITTSVAALVQVYDYPITTAAYTSAVLAGSYLAGLITSLLVYRIWLSPLNKFPGPFLAKITSLWMTTEAINKDLYLKLEELHNKYGRYVRTGPNCLSIINADVHDAAFDQKNPWRKAEWYDASQPYDSMHTTRNKALHDRRRRVWAPAFSDKALRDYEVKVDYFNKKLVDRLKQFGGGTVNASKWFNLYSFDVMGQLSFGKDYGQLETGHLHEAIGMLNESMEATPPRVPVWLVRILLLTPNETARRIFKFLKFCRDELAWRIENVNSEGDITGWILKAYKDFKSPADDPMFQGDTRLIIVAGSDTTAATMAHLFYHLAKNPEQAQKLREELQPLTQGDWTDASIRNAPHLNGAINEALRLHPPVPSGVERMTPKGGAQYGDVYLPGDVQFWMPQYVIGRSEENYENALEFVPERWYSKPDMIKHKNAFAPFSLGSQGCIGKNLAYMELRTLTAQLLLNFEVSLAPGEDGHRLLYKTRDHFTLGLGDLDLQFTPIAS